jgi:hypothetical protein
MFNAKRAIKGQAFKAFTTMDLPAPKILIHQFLQTMLMRN